MKYIKRNVQVVEPTINEDGYYDIGNVAIHPDIFHKQYQTLGFTLSTEEVEIVKYHFAHKQKAIDSLLHNMEFDDERDTNDYIKWKCQYKEISDILTRIKQYQDDNR